MSFHISKAEALTLADWFKVRGYYVDMKHTGKKYMGNVSYWDVYTSYKLKRKGDRPVDRIEWITGVKNHRWDRVNDIWKLIINIRTAKRGDEA